MEPSPTSSGRRLYRSRTERMISGVSGGIAEYFDIDAVIVRLAWVLLTFLSGGVLALGYLLLWILVPLEGRDAAASEVVRENMSEMTEETRSFAGQVREAFGTSPTPPASPGEPGDPVSPGVPGRRRRDRHLWAGAILIALGVIFLLDNLGLVWWFSWRTFWPGLLIAIGAMLLYQRARS
jgi:phage shock protein C